jgi:hypothetical protein
MVRSAVVRAAVVVAVVWMGAAAARAAAPPDLSGKWLLDPKRSDDVKARIDAAVGPGQVKSGGATGLTILPESNTRSEVERVELREWMLGVARQLDRIEIEQTAGELKLYRGDDVRVFYFGRESTRQSPQGIKMKSRARLEAGQVVLDQEGEKKTRVHETYASGSAAGTLVHTLRFENKLLKQPLEVRLFYVKEASQP